MLSAGRASELRQQGALEAARDPNSSVTAEAAERAALNEAKRAGSAGYMFDPDASPEEKAAQARASLPPGFHHERRPKAATLVSDVDDGSAPKIDLPPPSKDAIAAADVKQANGTLKEDRGNDDDDDDARWDKVGWAPRLGWPTDEDEGTLLDHQTWLETKLEDKFYGDWYHNTGIIIFACIAAWVVGILGGGLGWVVIVALFCGTYYRTSIRRVRRNFRDDINREMAKAKLETDAETLEWINTFLVKFWPIYAPVICDTIVQSVDQVLSTSCPAFLDSLRLKMFTLGTKPPRLEHVKSYPKSEDEIILMDWKFSFTPNDVADLTARQIKNKLNPKIVLEVRVGKGIVSKGLDVIVEDMAFSGHMRIKIKLQRPFPHIERVEVCFLERPTIDYVCKPLGGDTFGFDINFIPGLESFIMEQVHANLGPMMYAPNVFPVEVAKMLAGSAVDEAIGVLQVAFHGAQGLKNPDKFSGTPDPYATVSINNRAELARTATVHETASPRWNETVNIVITSLKDALTLNIFDYNEFRKDKELGQATFALERLEDDAEHENLQLEVTANGKPRGLVSCDIRFFPVLEGARLEDGTVEPPPESASGIAKFTVDSAKELDASKSLVGQLSPYAVLLLNGKEAHISAKLKRTNNPVFSASKELLITDRRRATLGLIIKDDRDLAADPRVGAYSIKLDDMLENMAQGKEWYNLHDCKTGRAKMTLQWKPVALKSASGTGGYVTPIGVMRIHFQSARGLRNLEAVGKSDPYARVLLSGVEKGKTVTWKNNLNPDWDEVVYVPVHSARERLLLEVMDQESLGKDRSLGHVEVAAADFVRQNDDGEYLVDDRKVAESRGLVTGPKAQPKGTLNFTVSFYPTHAVVDPEDDDDDEKEKEAARKSAASSRKSAESDRRGRNGTIAPKTDGSSSSSSASGEVQNADGEEAAPAKKTIPKLKITVDDLQKYESGIIVFRLLEAQLSQTGCFLEVLLDDNVFPSWTSSKVKSKHMTFNEVGDAMVRELDFSKITLRLIEEVDDKGEGGEDHVIAKLSGPTLDTLRRCLYTPTELSLRDNDGRESKVTVSLKYLPVKMALDPSESFNNSGTLRVDVLDAADLPAADRNGYSDPYCKFILNGKEVHKTKTQKKTLHPAWNEFFEAQVRSRTAAQFEVKVYDWDFGDKADFLGAATIDLEMLEPFQKQEVTLGLDGKSGAIRLSMLFKPDYIVRSRQGSSTFSGTFAAPGKVIGAPVKGVGKGAVLVGGGVIKGASFIGRGFKRRAKSGSHGSDDAVDGVEANGSTPTPPALSVEGQLPDSPAASTHSPHRRHRSWGAASIASQTGAHAGAESGTANITVLSASGFPPSTNVRVHVRMDTPKGPKEVHKTKAIKASSGDVTFDPEHESFRVGCTADAQFRVLVKDHATFASDEELGEGTFFVDDQGAGGEKVVKIGPSGRVLVRSSFTPSDVGSLAGSPGGSRLKRGMFGTKREPRESMQRERSLTPGV